MLRFFFVYIYFFSLLRISRVELYNLKNKKGQRYHERIPLFEERKRVARAKRFILQDPLFARGTQKLRTKERPFFYARKNNTAVVRLRWIVHVAE